VANSAAGGGVSWAGQPFANPVLNSAFDIWQRGTSFTSGSWAYTADRWAYDRGLSGSGGTLSRVASSVTNIQYAVRMARTSGDTNTNGFELVQAFETVNSIPYAGRTITFSFYAVAGANYSSSSNQLQAIIYSGTGTDQSATSMYLWTGVTTPISTQAVLTTSVQRFTYTATIPSNSTQLGIYFYRGASGTAGAADYADITGVQIDLGSVALPYRRNASTLQGELAACQRYYWRTGGDSAYQSFAVGSSNYNAGVQNMFVSHPTMRTAPTSVDYSNLSIFDGSGWYAITTITIQAAGKMGTYVSSNATSTTAFRPCLIQCNNTTAGYLGLSAEL
jgi:hypothetical protein